MGYWTSTASRVRALRQRTWHERRVFVLSLLLVPIIAAAVRWLGFGPLQRIFTSLSGSPARRAGAVSRADVHAIAWGVTAAAQHGWFKANCLERSLLLYLLLRRSGAAADLHIGVRRDGAALEAHAWVEMDGEVLADTVDVRVRFAPFGRAITSLRAGSR